MDWNVLIFIAPFVLLIILFSVVMFVINRISKFLDYDYEHHQYRDKEYHESMHGKGTWRDV